MKRALPAAAFCVVYLAADFLAATLPLPVLWHLPLERRFIFAVRPLGLAADFGGRVLFAAACGCAGAALAAAGAHWQRSHAPRAACDTMGASWLGTLLAWSASLLVLGASLHVWTLARRKPLPAPLPEGYVAR